MRILLDTHIVLWWLADAPELSPRHRALIEEGRNEVFVSSISVAEIAIKASLGKLDAPTGVPDALNAAGLAELDFTAAHAEVLRGLPWHHRDPFDRMLVAQALVDELVMLTVDPHVRAYFVE